MISAIMKSLFWLILVFFSSSGFALSNGSPLSATPEVVRLKFNTGWVCTGLILDQYTILTAAHCIYSHRSDLIIHLERIISENDQKITAKQIKMIPHPKFDNDWLHAHDVGIVKVSKMNVMSHFKLFADRGNYFFGKANLFGCGRTDPSKNEFQRTTGSNTYMKLGPWLLFFGSPAIAPNDSGGPVTEASSLELIGLAFWTPGRWFYNLGIPGISIAVSTRTGSNYEFISKNMGPSKSL